MSICKKEEEKEVIVEIVWFLIFKRVMKESMEVRHDWDRHDEKNVMIRRDIESMTASKGDVDKICRNTNISVMKEIDSNESNHVSSLFPIVLRPLLSYCIMYYCTMLCCTYLSMTIACLKSLPAPELNPLKLIYPMPS